MAHLDQICLHRLANTVLVGGLGVWQFSVPDAPTATPNPCQELLLNGKFEYGGFWHIPVTAYSAP